MQDLREWECLVIDDASTDDTTDIARRHAEEDPRIELVRRDRNVGLAAARNTGIGLARGRFLTFVDADDFMFPATLAARVHAATSDDPTIAGSWCDWSSVAEAAGLEFEPSGPGRFAAIDYHTGGGENQVISTSPLMRTDVVRSLGGYDVNFRTAEDFEFATRLFRNGFRLEYAGVVGVAYRQKRSSMISGDPFGHARNAMRVYDYMARPLDPAARSPLATAAIVEPTVGIPSEVKLVERLISFLTFALLGNDSEQVDGVLGLIPPGLIGSSSFLLDVDGRIDAAVLRHSTRVAAFTKSERTQVENKVKALLAVRGNKDAEETVLEPHMGVLSEKRVTAALPSHSRVRRQRLPGTAGPWDVVLVAESSDAARELALLGRELVELGYRVALHDLGFADLRRTALQEGIHRVVAPTDHARLVISSSGDTKGVTGDSHMIVASEPWVALVPSAVPADVVHLRGEWERALFPTAERAVFVGWHSRHDQLIAAASPIDGQANRGRSDVVIVARDSSDGAVAVPTIGPLSSPVLWSGWANSPAGYSLDAVALRQRSSLARAVVCSGPGVLADALAFGTPVVAVDDAAQAIERIPSATWESISRFLDDIGPPSPPTVLTDIDPLREHVHSACQFLE